MCMEIYLIGTYAEILNKFYKVVFLGKFKKIVSTGDENSTLHIKMSKKRNLIIFEH